MNAETLSSLLADIGASKLKTRELHVTACCPLCPDTNPSFGITLKAVDKGDGSVFPPHVFNCYACKEKGSLLTLVLKARQTDRPGALRFIRKYDPGFDPAVYDAGGVVTTYEDRFQPRLGEEIPYLTTELFDDMNIPAMAELKRRGIRVKTALSAGVKRDAGTSRLVFPWFYGPSLMGFTSRSYVERRDRMRGLPYFGFKKHRHVYFARGSASFDKKVLLYLVEGELDALRMQSDGFEGAGAGGSILTTEQARQILSVARAVILVRDNDVAGAQFEATVRERLAPFVPVYIPSVLPKQYSDPCKASKALLKQVVSDDKLKLI